MFSSLLKTTLILSFIFIIPTLLPIGCSTRSVHSPGDPYSEQKIILLEADIDKARSLFGQGNYEGAALSFKEILKKYPFSPFEQQIKLDLGQTYHFLNIYSESLRLYKEVIFANSEKFPSFAGEALFLSALTYDAMGENIKALTSLNEALNYKGHLSEEMIFAEIPARLAVAHQKLGNKKEALSYLDMAEQGAQQIKRLNKSQKGFLARIYYQMSELSSMPSEQGSIYSQIEALMTLQSFSIKAIEENDPTWSSFATKNLESNYNSIWMMIKNMTISPDQDDKTNSRSKSEVNLSQIHIRNGKSDLENNKTPLDPQAKKQQLTESQFKLSGHLLRLLEKLNQSKFFNFESNSFLQNLLSYSKNLETEINQFINTLDPYNPLTDEKKNRIKNSL